MLGRSRKAGVFRRCEQFGRQFAEEGARPGSLVAVRMRKGQPGQLYGVAIKRDEATERSDDIVPSLFEVEQMREHRSMAKVRGIGDQPHRSVDHVTQAVRTAVAEGIGYRDMHRQRGRPACQQNICVFAAIERRVGRVGRAENHRVVLLLDGFRQSAAPFVGFVVQDAHPVGLRRPDMQQQGGLRRPVIELASMAQCVLMVPLVHRCVGRVHQRVLVGGSDREQLRGDRVGFLGMAKSAIGGD